MELVKQDIRPLDFLEVIVYPHFVMRYELIDVVVSPLGKVDIEHAPHETTVDDPDLDP